MRLSLRNCIFFIQKLKIGNKKEMYQILIPDDKIMFFSKVNFVCCKGLSKGIDRKRLKSEFRFKFPQCDSEVFCLQGYELVLTFVVLRGAKS
jgi:hypothetical protein